jgi:hypothetical protein
LREARLGQVRNRRSVVGLASVLYGFFAFEIGSGVAETEAGDAETRVAAAE